jgi:hypothetical protein
MRRYFRPQLLLWLTLGLLLSLLIWGNQFFEGPEMVNRLMEVVAQPAMNRTLVVGTDTASIFLYHPDDLAHRRDDPPGWCYYDFAIRKEFAAGNVIGFSTGGDSGFPVRLTTGGLTEAERQHVVGSQTYRLLVRHGRLYLDGGYTLPDGGYRLPGGRIELPPAPPEYDPNLWVELPNGSYRVTVSTFNWGNRGSANDELPSYTFQFQSIARLEEVDIPTSFPNLIDGEGLMTEEERDRDQTGTPFERGVLPLISFSEVIFPEIRVTLPLNRSQSEAIKPPILLRSNWAIAVSSNPNPQALATLVQVASLRDGTSTSPPYGLSGDGRVLIRLRRIFVEGGSQWAEVERYELPAGSANADQIAQLKALFSRYAATHADYRRRVAYPGFYAEEITALDDPRSLGWRVANALVLPLRKQYDLLALSDRALLQKLSEILSQKLD